MLSSISNKLNLLTLFFCLGLFLSFWSINAATDSSPDAIAVRVMPNPDHESPLAWYYDNVDIKGAPQSLIVNGYEAVRDGRTVYVNAANVVPAQTPNWSPDMLYTNIYIISFNQQATDETRDIFGQLLQYWKFNADLVDKTGPGICQPKSTESCDMAKGCTGKFIDNSCEDDGSGNFFCVKKCLLSDECSYGQYCDSVKAKLVRDVKRMADMREAKIAFEVYNGKNKKYPGLPSGSYLPNKSISVWPSWNETLGKTLGYKLPQDPVNRLQNCPASFDSVTCWNEVDKKYASSFIYPDYFPEGSLAFAYSWDPKTNVYLFCANFETKYAGIPEDLNCLGNPIKLPNPSTINIILGTLNAREGSFRDYLAVNSDYPIDWSSLRITADWNDWYRRGWRWSDNSKPGLKLEDIKNFDNQKALVAKSIDLSPGRAYEFFDLEITVSDIYGNVGSTKGTIKVCNPADCQSSQAECGRLADGCGGTLLCGDCLDSNQPDCVANKCIKL